MGYYSDVRIVTTKKGWEYVREHAPKLYEDKLRSMTIHREDDEHIVVKKGGINVQYGKNSVADLIEKPSVYYEYCEPQDGYVLVGWDCVKWLGYSFDDKNSILQALEDSGEPGRMVQIGEDNMTEEYEWGDYYDGVDGKEAPMLEASACFDYGDQDVYIAKLKES